MLLNRTIVLCYSCLSSLLRQHLPKQKSILQIKSLIEKDTVTQNFLADIVSESETFTERSDSFHINEKRIYLAMCIYASHVNKACLN